MIPALTPYIMHIAGAFAAWSIVTTVTAAWPAIVRAAKEGMEL